MKRSRLLLGVGAVAAVAVIVAVVLVVVAPWKSDSKGSLPAVAEAVFAGVDQHGDTLGRSNARFTLTVFDDPQCPFCQHWALDTLPTVVDRYVRTGRVKLVYRGIAIIGPESTKGIQAIYAAGAQNKLWNLADELYRRQGAENSGWITDALISEAATTLNINGPAILAATSSVGVGLALAKATREAHFAGVAGTPTFFIARAAGPQRQLTVSSLDPAPFTAALDAALR